MGENTTYSNKQPQRYALNDVYRLHGVMTYLSRKNIRNTFQTKSLFGISGICIELRERKQQN